MQSPSCASGLRRVRGDPNRELLLQLVEKHADLDGRFSDIQRLGNVGGGGVFSLMFTAFDNVTASRVALKVYHPERNDPYRRGCFEREESLLRSVAGQPDIIRWVAPRSRFSELLPTGLAVGYAIDFDYYALELADSDFRSAIAGNAWGITEILRGFRDACRGVQRLHASDIVHRDLKPENFLVVRGFVVVSDLGAARRLDDATPALRPIYDYQPGDVRYAAPEMLACVHDAIPEIAYRADV